MDNHRSNLRGGAFVRAVLGVFALLMAVAIVFPFGFAWLSLFREHGNDAASVIREHWQALAVRSVVLLLAAVAFSVAGVSVLRSK